jgi:hypothetical protein
MTYIAIVPDLTDPYAPVLPPDSEPSAAAPDVRDPPPSGPPG